MHDQAPAPDNTAVRVALGRALHVHPEFTHIQDLVLELGLGVPDWLRLVPVDFEAGDDCLSA